MCVHCVVVCCAVLCAYNNVVSSVLTSVFVACQLCTCKCTHLCGMCSVLILFYFNISPPPPPHTHTLLPSSLSLLSPHHLHRCTGVQWNFQWFAHSFHRCDSRFLLDRWCLLCQGKQPSCFCYHTRTPWLSVARQSISKRVRERERVSERVCV